MEDSEEVLVRFNRLMRDLERGAAGRNCFRPWELQLLVDLHTAGLARSESRKMLQRYRKTVERQLENGARLPMPFSEFLRRARAQR